MKKVALIIGGSTAPGPALAIALGEAGFDLALQHHRTAAAARETARRVDGSGRRSLLVEADPRDPAEMSLAVGEVMEAYGRLDVLVNVGCRWEDGFLPTVHAVRAAAPLLAATGGSVVHVLQDPVQDTRAREALRRLTQGMAGILAPQVRVNAVARGRSAEASPARSLEEGRLERDTPHLVRTLLFVLGSPHLNGELVLAEPGTPGG